jgi:hypothetical protein
MLDVVEDELEWTRGGVLVIEMELMEGVEIEGVVVVVWACGLGAGWERWMMAIGEVGPVRCTGNVLE